MENENEVEWWDKYVDYKTHIPTEFFVPVSDMDDLVEEAMRRGEVKAWEELSKYSAEQREKKKTAANEYKKDGLFGLERQMDGEAVVYWLMHLEAENKLTSLKTP